MVLYRPRNRSLLGVRDLFVFDEIEVKSNRLCGDGFVFLKEIFYFLGLRAF